MFWTQCGTNEGLHGQTVRNADCFNPSSTACAYDSVEHQRRLRNRSYAQTYLHIPWQSERLMSDPSGTGNNAPGLTTAAVLLLLWAALTLIVRLWVKLKKADSWGSDDSIITVSFVSVTLSTETSISDGRSVCCACACNCRLLGSESWLWQALG